MHRGDADWEHALWAWKCSVIVGVTLREHLFELHLTFANVLNMAATETLSPTHPIRRYRMPSAQCTPLTCASADCSNRTLTGSYDDPELL